MNDTELLTFSDTLHTEATEVIRTTRLVEHFSTLGKVAYVGSYPLNLMYRPEINLYILSYETAIEKARVLSDTLRKEGIFSSVGFTDHITHASRDGLRYYLWKLSYILRGREWRIEVRYTAESTIKAIDRTRVILEKLSQKPNARLEILKLKHENFNGLSYGNKQHGFRMYEQVLGLNGLL